jgi:hypothetical protein
MSYSFGELEHPKGENRGSLAVWPNSKNPRILVKPEVCLDDKKAEKILGGDQERRP